MYSAFEHEYEVRQGHGGHVVLWIWMNYFELETIGL